MVTEYMNQREPAQVVVFTDTDHAGCINTRKSTNRDIHMHGTHLIKSWSTTQGVVALSSGEPEDYGLIKGTSEGL